MSFGEVDTLNMLFDKLQALFDESQGYYESFLDTNNLSFFVHIIGIKK